MTPPKVVYFITGAANGIGKAICKELASENRVFYLLDNRFTPEIKNQISAFLQSSKSEHHFIDADTRNQVEMESVIQRISKEQGKLDCAIACAGVSTLQTEEQNQKTAKNVMEINYFGVLNTIYPCIDLMNRSLNTQLLKSIVVISSIGALVTTQNSGDYSASKAALRAKLESLQLTNNSGITFTEIVLGFVDTDMTSGLRHATKLSLPVDVAAKRIIWAVNSKKHSASIPRFKNIPWWLMSHLPRFLRTKILHGLWILIYGKIRKS